MGGAKSHQAQPGAIEITRIGQLGGAKRHDGAIAVAKLFADFPEREPCRRKAGREVSRLDEQVFSGHQITAQLQVTGKVEAPVGDHIAG